MQRCALDFGDRVKASQSNNGDGFGIIPALVLVIDTGGKVPKITNHTPFFQSSFVNTTAHMASSPLSDERSVPEFKLPLSLPLSPSTVPLIPRSIIPKSMACTARLSL